jgi:flagellar hook-length control protein FliK
MRPGDSGIPVERAPTQATQEGRARAPGDDARRRANEENRSAAGQAQHSERSGAPATAARKAGESGKRPGVDQRNNPGSAEVGASGAKTGEANTALGAEADEALRPLDHDAAMGDGASDAAAMATNPALQEPRAAWATAGATSGSEPADPATRAEQLAGAAQVLEGANGMATPGAVEMRQAGMAAAQRQGSVGASITDEGQLNGHKAFEGDAVSEVSSTAEATQGLEGATLSAGQARFTEALQVAQRGFNQQGDPSLTPTPGGASAGVAGVAPLASGPATWGGPSASASGMPHAFETAVAAPLLQPGFAQAMGSRITTLVKDGIERASIRLNPAEMGPVAVKLALEGTQVRVEMSADMAATRQVLEQALPSLASALREAGFTLSGGGVFQQPQGQAGDDPSRQGREGSASAASALDELGSDAPVPSSARARVTDSLVDVFA